MANETTQSDNPKGQDTDHALVESLRGAEEKSRWGRLWRGLLIPLRAAKMLLTAPTLWPWVAVPALINLTIFGGVAYLLISHCGTIVELLWHQPPLDDIYGWILRAVWYVAAVLVGVFSLVASYIFVLIIGGLIASPFNDVLSEHSEGFLLARDRVVGSDDSLIKGAFRAIVSTVVVLGSYAIIMAPILLLNLIPAIGSVLATVLGTGVSAMFLALEFTDSPLDRRGRRLRGKFELLEENRSLALGFGLGTSMLLWIPLVNFLTIPIAVVGGTALAAVLDDWDRQQKV